MQNGLCILVVDDEPAVAQALCYVLEQPGRKFVTAGTAEEGLRTLANGKFDIIITDHKMPGMSGLDLVRRLREQKFDGKIVVLSAHLSPENIRSYTELAVNHMLPKPFDLTHLRSVIDSFSSGNNGA